MKEIKKRELQILQKICIENNLNFELMKQLTKTAEKNAYETQSPTARRKEYTDLIDFYTKQAKVKK